MHNIPKNVEIICTKNITAKDASEILKLCIDANVHFDFAGMEDAVDPVYPNYSIENGELKQCKFDLKDKEENEYPVSIEQFKAFLKGKGNVEALKIPFKERITLSDQRDAVVTKEGISVGCEQFSHDVIKKLYQLSQKAQRSDY